MDRTIRVIASDGRLVGRLSHVVAERGAAKPTGLVIEREGSEVVLPLAAVDGSDGQHVKLQGGADDYSELPPFVRVHYRVIDEEIAMKDELEEDFQVGGDEEVYQEGGGRELHTGAENPYRTPVAASGDHDPAGSRSLGNIAEDATGEDSGPQEEVAARTRRSMH